MTLSLPFFQNLAPRAPWASSTEYVRAALPPRMAASSDVDPGVTLSLDTVPETEIIVRSTERILTADAERDRPAEEVKAGRRLESPALRAALPLTKEATAQSRAAESAATRLPVRGDTVATASVAQGGARVNGTPDQGTRRNASAVSGVLVQRRGAPLSEAVRAQRAAAASAERSTVVQVTIDRIDVRAPAAPASAERLPKKRGGSTQSLGDYLRQRESTGNNRGSG